MLVPAANLSPDVFSETLPRQPTRDGFGRGVVEAGAADERVVVLCADLKESTRADAFEKEFPGRFLEMGVAEQNMATVASGMAAVGKIPFITSYAAFNPGRNYEQIRTTIALNRANVKVCGMHAGVSVGPDGATHQMLEDIGMMRMLPGMTVLVPGDAEEARKAVLAAAKIEGPVYLRFGRAPVPIFTTAETPFEVGKALVMWDSEAGTGAPGRKERPMVAIVSTGALTYTALLAARALAAQEIGSIVLHIPTVKPFDAAAVRAVGERAGRILTLEEHQVAGGFGSAVAEYVSEHCPMPVRSLGIQDQFGQSGTPEELLVHYGLAPQTVVEAVRSFSTSYHA